MRHAHLPPRSAIVRLTSAPCLRWIHRAIPLLATVAASACAHTAGAPAPPNRPQGPTLRAFQDEAELAQYHRALVEAILSKPPLGSAQTQPVPPPPPPPPGTVPGPGPALPSAPPRSYGEPRVGVRGDYLVVLLGGRLSTFRIARGALERVASVDAMGPGGLMDDGYFRELLVSDAGVQVVAVEDGGRLTHVARFRLGADGRLAYRDGVLIRAPEEPYYGAGAIREAGDGLVIVHQMEVEVRSTDVRDVLPSAWSADAAADTGARVIAAPGRVFRPVSPMSWPDRPVLSTVTVCRGPDGRLACTSSAVYTPDPEVVHVSPNALYLWTPPHRFGGARDGDTERKLLYRVPFDGSAATALPVTGAPQRPEAFMESADGHLNVSLLFDGWTRETHSLPPTLALLRVPLSAFGDGSGRIVHEHYRALPRIPGQKVGRFVGDWLVYGTSPYGAYLAETGLIAQAPQDALGLGRVRWAGGDEPEWFGLRAPVVALEPVRPNAALALIGAGDTMALAYVRLADSVRASAAAITGILHEDGTIYGVAHHAVGPDAGLLAVTTGVMPDRYSWRATGVAVLRYDAAGIRQIGRLASRTEPAGSREVLPVFADGRLFALLGGELVEVAEENGALREVRRIPLP